MDVRQAAGGNLAMQRSTVPLSTEPTPAVQKSPDLADAGDMSPRQKTTLLCRVRPRTSRVYHHEPPPPNLLVAWLDP